MSPLTSVSASRIEQLPTDSKGMTMALNDNCVGIVRANSIIREKHT